MPTATPLLDTVMPSATACTIATAKIQVPVGQQPVHRHEERAEHQADRGDAERPVDLGQPPPGGPSTINGNANSVMPRLAIHSLVPRSLWTTAQQRVERADHHEQRGAEHDGAGERSDREEVDREAPLRPHGALLDLNPRDEGQQHRGRDGDDEERCRDAERTDEERRDRRAEREAEHVSGEQASEVLAEVVRVGEDHDAAGRWHGGTDPDARDEPADQDRCQRGAEPHQQQPDHVDADTEQHHPTSMTPVGERCDQYL